MNLRIGSGFDAHKFSEEEKECSIMLCGVAVPHTRPIVAHSDGDVALHALVDALLSAIGAGDIGLHFPPSDPQWEGKDSQHFVRHALGLLKEKQASVVNVALTIISQAPRVGPHRKAMEECIAKLLEISEDCVNVAATTTEHMGFTGRKEGIAVQAAALVKIQS